MSEEEDTHECHEKKCSQSDECRAAKKGQKLIETVGRFLDGSKISDEDCAYEDQSGAEDHGRTQCIMKEELGEEGIVKETDCTQRSQHDNGQCSNLEHHPTNVGNDEDEEADDPYRLSPLRRTGLNGLLCCYEVRLALYRKS